MFLGRVRVGSVSDGVVQYLVMTLKLHVRIKVLPSVHLRIPEYVIRPHCSVGDVFVFEPSGAHLCGGHKYRALLKRLYGLWSNYNICCSKTIPH